MFREVPLLSAELGKPPTYHDGSKVLKMLEAGGAWGIMGNQLIVRRTHALSFLRISRIESRRFPLCRRGGIYSPTPRMPGMRHSLHHLRAVGRKPHPRHQGRRLIRGVQSREAHARPAHRLRQATHTPEKIDHLIASIESELRSTQRTEIKSKDLGDMALARLAKLDDVAYIRFASVYKDFQSVEEFSSALGELG